MRALAPLVARQNVYKSDDYRDVIRELKKDQISGDAILPLYRDTLKTIEASIRREHTVTLPAREAKIRLASEAESAQMPARSEEHTSELQSLMRISSAVLSLQNKIH